ncbi:histidine kinase [Paenibacillus tarimensis]|uniref:sensor histidine kinase n=2 Tax=Paenibacillus tarimensis TaxID=416012 RepID=UPI0039EE9EA0|nr:sensor histidine kinase [Paenibacillus tarimensis]
MFNSWVRKFNSIKLRNKMILSYVFVIVIPLIIVGLFLVEQYRQLALDNAIEQTENNVLRVKQRTAEVLSVAIDLSSRLSLDSRLEDIANRRYTDTMEVFQAYSDYDTIRNYLDFNSEVSRIKMYVDNPTLINNWELIPLDEATRGSFWHQAAMQNRGTIGWFYFEDEARSWNSRLSMVRRVQFPEYMSAGALVIDINTNYLNASLNQEPFETYIMDHNDVIVASNVSSVIGKKLSETHLGHEVAMAGVGAHEISVGGKASKVFVEEFRPETSFNSLKFVSIFSIESIVSEANRISRFGMTIIAISFMIALGLIYVICTILANRLLTLNKQISKVSKGNLNTVVKVDGNDEIGLLSRQFNQMVTNVKDLMEEVQHSHEQKNQLELKQNEIKLKMLANQINPHFLYNALESIRMKAHLNGEKEIAQTVKLLGKLMRKNLEITGKSIMLKDEIEISRCYLEIQKFRHDERLDYELDIDPETEHAHLPPLIIQPLVENAVIHGLERTSRGGKVSVKARMHQGHIHITVTDNGAGIAPEKMKRIQQFLEDQDGDRIGLTNVQQRLKLTYGAQYGLEITSTPDQGTSIHFAIPTEVDHVQSINSR